MQLSLEIGVLSQSVTTFCNKKVRTGFFLPRILNTDVRRSGRSSRITDTAQVNNEDDEGEDQEENS